jgi:hypothetical protein
VVRAPFLPTHNSVLSLHRPTCTWPGQSPVARVAEPLSVARAERLSVARVVESLPVARVAEPSSVARVVEPPSVALVVEPPSVALVVEPLWLVGATTEAFGMVPEGGFGAGVGGHTV